MLHIFLAILKIIGILLAVLVGLLLLLLLAVLFVPLKYQLEGSFYTKENDDNYFKGKISFLGPFLRCTVYYKEEFQWNIKILFFSLNSIFVKKESVEKEEFANWTKHEMDQQNMDEFEELSEDEEELELINLNNRQRRKEIVRNQDEADNKQERQTQEQNKQKKNKIIKWLQKIKTYKQKLLESVETWRELLSNIQNFLLAIRELNADLRFKAAFFYIKDRIFIFLKKIKPSIQYFDVSFAANDPALTGKIVGAASIIYAYLQNPMLKVAPDFESEQFYFKGKGCIKGRIWILELIKLAYDYLFHKEVQYFKEKLTNLRRSYYVRK